MFQLKILQCDGNLIYNNKQNRNIVSTRSTFVFIVVNVRRRSSKYDKKMYSSLLSTMSSLLFWIYLLDVSAYYSF